MARKKNPVNITSAIICVAVLIPMISFGQAASRKKIAVVPNNENPQIVSVLEGVLGKSARFSLLDRRQLTQVMKEWKRRQLGMTEKDDTAELYIMDVDYLVSVEKVEAHTFMVTYSSSKKVDWQTNLTARLKVVYLKEGGRARYYEFESKGLSESQYESPRKAAIGAEAAIDAAVRALLPIEADLFKADSRRINLAVGSSGGVEAGQRYIVRERDGAGVITDKGFAMIDQVQDSMSGGYLISGGDFDEKNSTAIEKEYSDWALEFYGGLASYRMNDSGLSHDIGSFDLLYGFRLLTGNNFQFGWGFNTDFPGSGRFTRVLLSDFSLRYNFHLIKRLYVFIEGGVGIESAYIRQNLRSEKVFAEYNIKSVDGDGNNVYENTRLLSSYALSGNIGAGLKIITGQNTYLFASVNYTGALDFKSWSPWELYLFQPDPVATDLMDASIKKYDKYIQRFSPAGPRAHIGFGIYF